MAKAAKNLYACGECGATAPKWQGQCPGCGAWNTLVETRPEPAATGNRFAALAGASRLQSLAEVEAREEDRLPTGIAEFDRVTGGGMVGSAIAIGRVRSGRSARLRTSSNTVSALATTIGRPAV